MFEESLIADKMSKAPRKRKTYLSLAFFVHALGFLSMLFFQYWSVEALPEPPIPISFFTAMAVPTPPPPPPPPAPEPVTAPPQPQPAPAIPVQPVDIPLTEPEPAPEVIYTTTTTSTEPGPPSISGDGVPGPVSSGPAAPNPDQVWQVGGEVSRPVATFQPQPRYPELARKVRAQGAVILEAIIDRDGNVTDVKLRKGLPYGLSDEALKAVKQWKFKPATLNGKPVAVFYTLTVRFTLQ